MVTKLAGVRFRLQRGKVTAKGVDGGVVLTGFADCRDQVGRDDGSPRRIGAPTEGDAASSVWKVALEARC